MLLLMLFLYYILPTKKCKEIDGFFKINKMLFLKNKSYTLFKKQKQAIRLADCLNVLRIVVHDALF